MTPPRPAPTKARHSIDALMREYLAALPDRRRRRDDGGVTDSLQLLQHALEGYGYQYLSRADGARYEAARDEAELSDALRQRVASDPGSEAADELQPAAPFCRMFGVALLVKYLDEFLDDFMIRKVLFTSEMVEATINDVRGFLAWLGEHGHLTAGQTRTALGRIARGADEVPAADRLSSLLYEEGRRSEAQADRFRDAEIIEDFLVVERVAPGRIWLIGVDGPLKVPEAASRLARPGWTINLVIGRDGEVWRVLEVGNVYPRTLA